MMGNRRWKMGAVLIFSGLYSALAYAQEATPLKPFIDSMAKQAEGGMSVWQLIQAGGLIMMILLILSIGTMAIIVYNYLTLHAKRLVPEKFSEDIIQALERKDEYKLKNLCTKNNNIISRIVTEGMRKKKHGFLFAKEAMEISARKEISILWQNISYLSDIATIAPLIGLLGTVLGMIQAFNVIAFQTAVVKPILLAGGVSKAMVTTAGGLIVAIPTMLMYSYFRSRVQTITNIVENYSADIIKLMESLGGRRLPTRRTVKAEERLPRRAERGHPSGQKKDK